MNKFEYLLNNEDMGASIVENIFINHYMPNADGEYVKVYLWGLKYAYYGMPVAMKDADIASALGLLESDVSKAWAHWQKEGILRIIPISKEEKTIQYLNIKSVVLSSRSGARQESKELLEKEKKRKQMFLEIEDVYNRPLSSKELSVMNAWIDEFGFTIQTVLLLIHDCASRGHTELNYVSQVAQNWYDANVRTYDEGLDYLTENKTKWDQYFQIFKYLGFNRMPSRAEQKLIDGWFDTYGFDMEIIQKALDTTVAIDKPSIKYVDSVLKDWFESGEIKEKPKKTSVRKKSKHKLSNTHEYDFEELEKRWLNKTEEIDEKAD